MTKSIKYTFPFIALLLLLLSSCNSNEDVIVEDGSNYTGALVQQDVFQAGDQVTRSTLIFGDGGLKFDWVYGDEIGMYATAKHPTSEEEKNGLIIGNQQGSDGEAISSTVTTSFFPTDPVKTQQAHYKVIRPASSNMIAKIEMDASGNEAFDWDTQDGNTRWTVYAKYNPDFVPTGVKTDGGLNYNALPFDFTNQTQKGLVDMNSYYTAGGYNSVAYANSEKTACEHIGEKDVLISSETQFTLPRTIFHMRHLGAVARFFLLAPDKAMTLKSLKLICDKKIFYEKGKFDLSTHPYAEDDTKGIRLVGDEAPLQMAPQEETLTNNLELKFANGVTINKTTSASGNPYSNYLVAYLMMYPITYNAATDGNLYVYVTAEDSDGKEIHFVSEPLANKTMRSGYYYQWTSLTHEQDGLYPIELTATLLPWQNIVGGGIEVDMEK